MPDDVLLGQIIQKDRDALTALYNRYSPIVYPLLQKITEDEAAAGNLLIDVFLTIWQKSDAYPNCIDSPYTYIILIARNKAHDYVRQQRAVPMIAIEDETEEKYLIPKISRQIDLINLDIAFRVKARVEKALLKLTEAQQFVIYNAYYLGMTESEIASQLNIPVQTVKAKVRTSMMTLRDNLFRSGE